MIDLDLVTSQKKITIQWMKCILTIELNDFEMKQKEE
jgi:hypothetical protein